MLILRSLYHLSPKAQQAFTLLEMLVVLFIIGLGSGMVMMNIKPHNTPKKPELIEFLEKERSATLLNSQATQIQLQKNGLYATTSKNTFSLPEKPLATDNRYLPTITLVTFYPDGTQTASKFTLRTKTHTYEIETNPFSNKIQYTEQETPY